MSNETRVPPSQPNFYQQVDLGTSNHDVQQQACSCANSSFPEPENYVNHLKDYINKSP